MHLRPAATPQQAYPAHLHQGGVGGFQSHQRREQWAATSGHAAGLDTDAPQAVCSDERPPRREIVCGKYSPPLSGRADGVTVPDRDRLLEPMI